MLCVSENIEVYIVPSVIITLVVLAGIAAILLYLRRKKQPVCIAEVERNLRDSHIPCSHNHFAFTEADDMNL